MEAVSTIRLFLDWFLFENTNKNSYGIIKDNIFNLNNIVIVIYQTKTRICRDNIERVVVSRWPGRVVFGVGSEPVGFKNANVNILNSLVNDLVIRSGITLVFTESTQTASPKEVQHLPTTE